MQRRVVAVLVASAFAVEADVARAAPGDLRLASANAAGAAADGESLVASVSGDGSKVAFFSTAANLDPADADAGADVYVKDLQSGAVTLVSRSASGVKGNGESRLPAISADGTRVAFISEATNLHPARVPGVYVKHLATGAVELVSATAAGAAANAGADRVVLSADGRVAAFSTPATNLDPADPVADFDVYVKDLDSGRLTLASLSAAGQKRVGLFGSLGPALSADGRRVAFHSDAPGLHPADGDATPDVFVRDLASGQLLLASSNDLGAKGNAQSAGPSLSADGATVAFSSYATNFDPAVSVNGFVALYVKDLASGDLSLASRNAAGALILGGVSNPVLSADARRLAFSSSSTNAHPADADAVSDVFVKDLATGHVFLASASSAGVKGNGTSYVAVLSADGAAAAFRSDATNLDPADGDSASDIFAKELGDVVAPPDEHASLAVTQSDAPDPVLAGQPLTYEVRVRNNGPASATGVALTEELDASVRLESAIASRGSCAGARCELGALAPGETATVIVQATPLAQGTIAALATVQAREADADTSDNTARVLTRVNPAADLSLGLTDAPDPARVHGRVLYRAEVTNAGPSSAGAAEVTIRLPDAMRVTAIDPACAQASGVVRCSLFGLEPRARVAVAVETTARRAGSHAATASVASSTTSDPALANNSATATTTVTR